MKSVLYVGATLMIGASIYGFVDYKQTGSKKEFKTMYAEEKVAPTEKVADSKTFEPVTSVKEITVADVKATNKAAVKSTTVKKSSPKKVAKKKRKFSTKLFSRGALDEKYIEPEVIEKAKTNTKKN